MNETNVFYPLAAIEAGLILYASYDDFNCGEDLVRILGVTTRADSKHAVTHYDSIREAMQDLGVTTAAGLEKYGARLVVSLLMEGDMEGDFFYMYDGNMCRGSGAEALTFTRFSVPNRARCESQRSEEEEGEGNAFIPEYYDYFPEGYRVASEL